MNYREAGVASLGVASVEIRAGNTKVDFFRIFSFFARWCISRRGFVSLRFGHRRIKRDACGFSFFVLDCLF